MEIIASFFNTKKSKEILHGDNLWVTIRSLCILHDTTNWKICIVIEVLRESVRINEEAIIPLQIYIILEGLSEEYIS